MGHEAASPAPGLSLRVCEAESREVGRGIVRVDPAAMTRMGVSTGDLVAIEGKRLTVGRVLPLAPERRGQGIIQMDGVLRTNARVALDETVTLTRTEVASARVVVLAPLTAAQEQGGGYGSDQAYLTRMFVGIPVLKGDHLRGTLLGARSLLYRVVETNPEGPALIQKETRFRLQEPSPAEQGGAEKKAVSYEDVGGLAKEVRRIREMVEIPLRYPELFERLGIDPPKGLLLYGPPGTGKTLLARAVAAETEAYFLAINGPEIMNKFYGESEAKLRELFAKAQQHAPSIIFLDELDALAPKREEVTGEVEKRVVAQLLALMDGLEGRGQVVVIAATNIPNALDPALRRPGRFDREFGIGIPDRPARLQILQIHTRGMPLAANVDLAQIAQETHGFVGADLAALCKEAAMSALRRLLPEVRPDLAYIPSEVLENLEVTEADFRAGLCEVEPSATREIMVEVPTVTWAEVGGLAAIKAELKEALEWPQRYPKLCAKLNLKPPRGILLAGPPGTGKTLLARAVASLTAANFIAVRGPELLSRWVGESEKRVREIFKKARQVAPCLIFFDELDALVPMRGTGGQSEVGERVLAQLLTEMDGIEELKGVTVLGATNRLDRIDPALLRPGRFDRVLHLPFPDAVARGEILTIHLRPLPLALEVNIEELVRETEGWTGAELAALCQQAAREALREYLREAEKQKEACDEGEGLHVNRRHFVRAHAEIALRQSGQEGK